jgi:hypothetical protein
MIPIAICSTKNAAQVMDFGAEQTFDYRDSDCASKIVGCTDIKNGYCAHADTLAYRSPTRRTILHTHSIASLPPSQPKYVSQHSDVLVDATLLSTLSLPMPLLAQQSRQTGFLARRSSGKDLPGRFLMVDLMMKRLSSMGRGFGALRRNLSMRGSYSIILCTFWRVGSNL